MSASRFAQYTVRDFWHATRGLARTPSFTLPAILTLALGIGGLATVGTVMNGVLLKPLPFAEPDRLVGVWLTYSRIASVASQSLPQSDASYFTLRQFSRSARALGAYVTGDANVDDGTEPERLPTASMTASALMLLEVPPLVGRLIRESDERPGQPRVVLISEGLWRRKFGAAPSVVGRSIKIDGTAHEVIGVMPARFSFPSYSVQLWRALPLDPQTATVTHANYSVIARLRPSVTPDRAQRDLDVAFQHTPELYPSAGYGISTRQLIQQSGARVIVHSMRDDVVGSIAQVLWILIGTAAFVLLVACANVANLFLVRAEARQREMAVRAALGAGRMAILTRVVGEGFVLGIAGAALGLCLTVVGVQTLVRDAPFYIPRLNEISVGGLTLASAALLAIVVGFVSSVLQMTQFSTRNIGAMISSGGRGATSPRERQRTRQILVVAQVALAFVLLVGSALLGRSFGEMRAIRPGFDPTDVLSFRIALPLTEYPHTDDAVRFYDRALERLRQLPGVRSAGASWRLPLGPEGLGSSSFWVENGLGTSSQASLGLQVDVAIIAGDYFATMGIPMLAGEKFAPVPDRPLAEAIVNAQFARQAWGDSAGREAIGRRIRPSPTSEWYTVVGVVGNVRGASLMQPPGATVYMSTHSPFVGEAIAAAGGSLLGDVPPYAMSLVLRSTADLTTTARSARREIAALDPTLPVFSLRPMRDIVEGSMVRISFTALLLGVAAAIALTLGIIGIYGVVAYTASLRTREIGLRLALGARPSNVVRLMTGQGAMLAGIGLTIGLVITLSLTRFLRALLFGVAATDPLVLASVALVLAAVTVIAAWLPARRAARTDPTTVLMSE